MKRISFGNRLTPALLTACVFFGVIFAFEWITLSRQDGITTGGDLQPTAATDIQLTRSTYIAPEFSAFSEILERPLFTDGRTPPEPPSTEQAPANTATPAFLTLTLEGIALTPEARIVVVRDIPSNKLMRLAEGAQHQGWVIESITASGATFKRGEQTYELTLELDKNRLNKIPSPIKNFRRKK